MGCRSQLTRESAAVHRERENDPSRRRERKEKLVTTRRGGAGDEQQRAVKVPRHGIGVSQLHRVISYLGVSHYLVSGFSVSVCSDQSPETLFSPPKLVFSVEMLKLGIGRDCNQGLGSVLNLGVFFWFFCLFLRVLFFSAKFGFSVVTVELGIGRVCNQGGS